MLLHNMIYVIVVRINPRLLYLQTISEFFHLLQQFIVKHKHNYVKRVRCVVVVEDLEVRGA